MKRVFFVGEINVDIIMGGLECFPIVDREVSCASFDLTIGSSTAICACAYSSLGGETWFMGLAGYDEYGDFMVRGMQSFGINTDFVRRTDSVKTGVTVNMIVDGTRTQVTYPGTIARFGSEHLDFGALGQCSHIHVGGPYLQTALLPEVTSLLCFARDHGITASLDPQWGEAQGWAHLDEWLPLLSWFFPNRDEALSITGLEDPVEACRELGKRTAFPLIKLGSSGALCQESGEVRHVKGFPVAVVDTTGAGDSFDAGFLFAVLEKGMVPLEAVRFANAVAARSCLFVGGVNARSSYQDAVDFLSSKGGLS